MRRLHTPGLFLLILAGLLHFAVWGQQHFGTLPATAVTLTALTAITAPAHMETCHHHVHGCPADCLCPKTNRVPQEAAATQAQAEAVGTPDPDTIREPGLVACTEKGAQAHQALPDSRPPDQTSLNADFATRSFPAPELTAPLQDWDGDPPKKVPIA